ncbi:hypothetical protein A4G26_21575 [Mycobacterium kansasii]|uniref:DUF5134 domain-containing protein n=1 Tax=Mycobacterium innocens TaxID=2341083 RepID=A0A498PPB7_9MYCO|nr:MULTISPECIES: DUF5134 domain-containing protein [Mycobacterium]KZS76629.1 hypothetical protein A4G26_21575 [Mycobacterium kansasii]VBA32220.1 hypothetical protein LAUMK13_00031 [Mycobacterium innocens]
MVDELLLRWLLTGLFVLSGATYVVAAIGQRRRWVSVVSNGLHLVMAIAMAVMIWPWGIHAPTTGPAVFFLLAAGWFVALTVVSAKTIAQWAAGSYHAFMMLAMTWMYVVMNGQLLPGKPVTPNPASTATSMPGMEMSAMPMPADSIQPEWVASVTWLWFLVFTIAAIVWAAISLAGWRRAATGCQRDALVQTGRISMALAMAIVFAVLPFGG